MKYHRKLPVEVEAFQWDGTAEGATPLIQWIFDGGATAKYMCTDHIHCRKLNGNVPHTIGIPTPDGTMHAALDDWIIKDMTGKFFPCRDDIFHQIYEAVTESIGDSQ